MSTIAGLVGWSILISSLLALAVAAASRLPQLRRRPAVRHALWLLVLAELITPPLVPLAFWDRGPAAERTLAIPHLAVAQTPAEPELAVPASSIPPRALDRQTATAGQSRARISAPVPERAGLRFAGSLLAAAWLLGIVLIGWHSVRQARQLTVLIGESVPAPAKLQQLLDTVVQQMQRRSAPQLRITYATISPLMWARLGQRPTILLPQALTQQCDDDQLQLILAHEVAHLSRRDHWSNWFRLVVCTLYWWHPVAWWARRELRASAESCCDALAVNHFVSRRRRYAETLLQVVDYLQTQRGRQPALATTFGCALKERFRLLADPRLDHRLSAWWYPLLLAIACLLPCIPTNRVAADQLPVDVIEDVIEPAYEKRSVMVLQGPRPITDRDRLFLQAGQVVQAFLAALEATDIDRAAEVSAVPFFVYSTADEGMIVNERNDLRRHLRRFLRQQLSGRSQFQVGERLNNELSPTLELRRPQHRLRRVLLANDVVVHINATDRDGKETSAFWMIVGFPEDQARVVGLLEGGAVVADKFSWLLEATTGESRRSDSRLSDPEGPLRFPIEVERAMMGDALAPIRALRLRESPLGVPIEVDKGMKIDELERVR